ncbi:hypothetical protein O3P69_006453 [Scylla paramamosain]|uniref:PiggyBac transposable element-derived protein domain-containing protein n=1 Tax=Scylla paramamosain TaxID=85552 RepID=A0AAW0U7C4_SCYPA
MPASAVQDYWSVVTRVPQAANLVSSKRFKLMYKFIHFNENSQMPGSPDRFFKVLALVSEDGFVHDMALYQGKTALKAHWPLNSKVWRWKRNLPRGGTVDYTTSDDGILAIRWKHNKFVTLLSTDLGVEPMSGISRCCSDIK